MLLGAGIFGLTLLVSVAKAAFLFFAACGIYLAVFRPKTWRGMPRAFIGALVAWAIWQIALSLARGEPLSGNRTLSYAALEFACALLPLGLGLVRRPAQMLALGARLALLALLVLTPIEYWRTGMRVGLGGNEAIFAFVVGVAALLARIPTGNAFRFLPDGIAWTYLGVVPIILSGTRAAMLLFVVTALVDAARLLPRIRASGRRRAGMVVGGLVLVSVAAVPLISFVGARIETGVAEMNAYEESGLASGSVDVRLAMWSSAVAVLAERPFVGVGGMSRMEEVGRLAGPNAGAVLRYQHLHNLVLDEALSSGLIGLALMLSVFGLFLVDVSRRCASRIVRDVSTVLVVYVFVFGLFHGVLLNEWMLLAIFGSMATILTELRRPRPFGLPGLSSR